jgi:hypothetical protein
MSERGDSCFPAVPTLAEETGLAESTVRAATSALEAAGWLVRDIGGGNRSNRYRALTPPGAGGVGSDDPTGSRRAPHREPEGTPPGAGGEDVIKGDIEDDKKKRALSRDTQIVYDHWRSARGKTRANYDSISDARRTKIHARFRDGFSVEELCRALDAVALDDWHARNQNDDLTQLFKSRERVDQWLDLADDPPKPTRKAGDAAGSLLARAREERARELALSGAGQ